MELVVKMSDEFLRLATQEIEFEINCLKDLFLTCINDEQFHKKSKEIEKHMHKIKGLAPMMGQEKVGEIARICDIILKYVITQGVLKDSCEIVSEAVKRINYLFSSNTDIETDEFRKQVISKYPHIIGF
jgi:hypothetical protein